MIEIGDVDAQSIIGNIPVVGILIALVGAVFLSLGALFQHRGVEVVEERHGSGNKAGLSVRQLMRLLARPSWVIGTVLLGLAILFQLASLTFAPLIVVQPIGAVALVITTIVNARVTKTKLAGPVLRAVALCVGGIALFVTVATFVAEEQVIGETQLVIVLSILGGVILLLALTFGFARKKIGALFYIVAAGVLYGFVATLAKVVINRVGNLMAGIVGGEFEWLTIACVVALVIAAALGAYFVQTAYSLGSPDLVIAGLTVVDPLLAVAIGIAVLGEAAGAPLWVIPVWALAASVAVYGVYQLAKHHPQTHR
ncbi:MAG: DMT family transporter [Pseudolysinimonas sp.]|uniref:DMT family transporter n=1 Tax=Pseudolysinimonas sp. TaxID=2680009 RepID=UPI003C77CF85